MRKMIFDVPAENGGALTILNQYYDRACKDIDNDYIFVVSLPELEDTKNVTVLNYPWIKKSWFHRLYFDKIMAPRIVKSNNVDEVLSLQNIIISKVKIKQGVYIHQSLPFSNHKFKLRDSKKIWVYQNIIGGMIKKSIKRSDYVIVQTNWMKEAILPYSSGQPIFIEQPKINKELLIKYQPSDKITFFYPASGEIYKNHNLIIEAVKDLLDKGIQDFEVIFTLKKDEHKDIMKEIHDNNLPIKLVGKLTQKEVFEYYSKSILVFPSYIETFGLPLLEARMSGCPIIVLREQFSEEILKDYDNSNFFDYGDFKKMSDLMKQNINY